MSETTSKNAVVLLSGGLDSATTAYLSASQGYTLYALTVDYNQRHKCELEAAKRVAAAIGVRQHIMFPLDLRLFGGSSLTSEMEVVKYVPLEKIGQQIPTSYVPARNLLFLSLALAFAETVNAETVFIGISATDYSGYPDCRPEFIEAFSETAQLATAAGVSGRSIRIETPLIGLSKKETILLGLSLGVDYSLTHTCYDPLPDGKSCGRCESCLLRRRGFEEAELPDPLMQKYV
ncbi:MAG: 7-cyano-7-deazaguanine synthase QueC [Planctomycetaceae bacterium]|nr:7-cyano-7-deazaguanine synthase QueC [Planctomycetaceae bacterium]